MAHANRRHPPRPAAGNASRRKRPGRTAAARPAAAAADGHPEPASMSRDALEAEVERARARLGELEHLRVCVGELETYREEAMQQQHELFLTHLALEDSRDRYAALYDLAPVVYMTLSRYGVIQEINLTGATLLGIDRARLLGTPLLVHVDGAARLAFLRHMQRCRAGDAVVTSELVLRPRAGPPVPVQLTSKLVSDDRRQPPALFATVVLDLTERRAAQQREDAYRQRLRAMASELSLTEERERRRIATALHDNLAQVLALARIKLGSLRKKLPDSAELGQIGELIAEALRQARSLTLELSPPVLYQFGLEAAIEWLGEQLRGHGLEVRVRTDRRAGVLPEDLKVLLFQAVRELLTNVVKHAGAKLAVVSITASGQNVEVAVEDDGDGFRDMTDGTGTAMAVGTSGAASGLPPGVGNDQSGGGFGLFNLRTRVEHLGGRMEIDTTSDGGARVLLVVPARPALPTQPPRQPEKQKSPASQQPQQPLPQPPPGNGQPRPPHAPQQQQHRPTRGAGDSNRLGQTGR